MRVRLVPVVLLLGLGLVACSKDVPGNELDVGDCVEDQGDLDGGNSTVSCDEDHEYELYAKVELGEDDDYPGDAEIESQANETCRGRAFEDYVGVPYVESEIYVLPRWPSESTWENASDRTILCFATTGEQPTASTGSVEGVNR